MKVADLRNFKHHGLVTFPRVRSNNDSSGA
jgi:hypothetical protein